MTSTQEIEKICARNIRRIRKDKNATQSVMAEKIGITEKYWSDIETARTHCSLDTLVAIANVLEVEPYELLLPEHTALSYDTRRTKVLMEQLKKNFSDMVDSVSHFLEEG